MINPKRNGMLFNNINPARYSRDLLPKRNSAEGHKSSPPKIETSISVTYKNHNACANGLLFSLILHAPTIKQAKEEDAMWAIHNWREYGVRPETQNVGGHLALQ